MCQWLLAPSQKTDPQLAMSSFWRGFGDFPYLWSGGCRFESRKDHLRKRPKMVLECLFMVFQCNLSALELLAWQPMMCHGQVCSCGQENRLLWKTSPLSPVDAVPFHGHRHSQRATIKHKYIYASILDWNTFVSPLRLPSFPEADWQRPCICLLGICWSALQLANMHIKWS